MSNKLTKGDIFVVGMPEDLGEITKRKEVLTEFKNPKIDCNMREGKGEHWDTCGDFNKPEEDWIPCSNCKGTGEVDDPKAKVRGFYMYENNKAPPKKEGEIHHGYTVIKDLLPFLKGRPYDEVAKGFVHSLRPSYVRECYDGITHLDANHWRVTIYFDKNKNIASIEQEVEVALHGDIQNGWDLNLRLKGKKASDFTDKNGNVSFCNTRALSKIINNKD